MNEPFRPTAPDFDLSPYTGMTRESWLEAAEWLLRGAFANVSGPDDPLVFPRSVLLRGKDSTGVGRSLAMTVWGPGWKTLRVVRPRGTSPDGGASAVPVAETRFERTTGGEPVLLVSQVLTRADDSGFAESELFPISEIATADAAGHGGFGPIRICMRDGSVREVDFDGIEGCLSI